MAGLAADRIERTRAAWPPVLRGGVPLLGMLPALARDALGVFERA